MASKISRPDPDNEKGIPLAIFIEDVKSFLTENFSLTVDGCDVALKHINELYTKYKFMEAKLLQQKKSMQNKIPEISQAISALKHIASKEEEGTLSTHLELSDAVFVEAIVTKPDSVLLWLGANVMVEYPRSEAKEMLETNLKTAQTSLHEIQSHIESLKDQITISEVNVARIHNYKVEIQRTSQPTAAQ